MRRIALIAAALLGASALAACQSRGVATPTPQQCIPKGSCGVTTSTTSTFPVVPAFHLTGVEAHGKVIFIAKCGFCHTLADAKTTGTIGPNLDSIKPDYQAATAQVTNGGGAMPPFKSELTTQQIADVATYVVAATGGTP